MYNNTPEKAWTESFLTSDFVFEFDSGFNGSPELYGAKGIDVMVKAIHQITSSHYALEMSPMNDRLREYSSAIFIPLNINCDLCKKLMLSFIKATDSGSISGTSICSLLLRDNGNKRDIFHDIYGHILKIDFKEKAMVSPGCPGSVIESIKFVAWVGDVS